jgi:hypothetical protein
VTASITDAPPPVDDVSSDRPRDVSGKLVVLAMFGFGLLLTGALYLYWELHTRPFRPLQMAIATSIPGSSPRVIGGKYKSHLPDSQNTLRMIVQVPFTPTDAAHAAECEDLAKKVIALARIHQDLAPYQQIALHLEHRIPEKEPEIWTKAGSPADWEAFAPADSPKKEALP